MQKAQDFEVIHAGRKYARNASVCRHPTESETDAIRLAILDAIPDESERLADMIPQDLILREDYISDGPGFAGTLAVLFWGEPHFVTVIGDHGSSGKNWKVIEIFHNH